MAPAEMNEQDAAALDAYLERGRKAVLAARDGLPFRASPTFEDVGAMIVAGMRFLATARPGDEPGDPVAPGDDQSGAPDARAEGGAPPAPPPEDPPAPDAPPGVEGDPPPQT